ncbi:hypothetical protein ASG52_16000 [Methylobacterium sp. Leaf456]|uniref:DUF29 domain-containing protein n=1 Tax=Methylobacterium sp. Leaf456 TaxID=1736382 RepID=UPI0006F59632|nr:DUF29 domain-containing protein [Methylobacterium sp. Leaf456]KQT60763.1 hypothetical protein ASG52_16000 [Methylobacterium sp. Leaf456]
MTKAALKPPAADDLYETDFHAWTQGQAELLRARRFDELDLENLIEEVASVGRSDRQQIESRLDVLLGHLLKWRYQPGLRNSHWTGTIDEQRRRIARVLKASPSLKRYPAEVFGECYRSGRLLASRETGIALVLFPETPPFTLEQALDANFLPKDVDLLDQS